MLNEFSRTELLIGNQGIAKLAGSAVAIFGVGGVGSYVAEGLARSGIGRFILVDDDLICLTNINRQIIAAHSTVGKPKVDVMAERIRDINPSAEVTALRCFYTAENAEEIDLSSCDYIVDAIDTVTSKLLLIERAKKINIPIISCMGAGNKLNPTKFEVCDIYKTTICPLARVMRKELRARGIDSLKVVYSKEQPLKPVEEESNSYHYVYPADAKKNCAIRRQVPGSISFVPSVAGLIIAGEVIKDLIAAAPKDD